jgi:hypothetical protein
MGGRDLRRWGLGSAALCGLCGLVLAGCERRERDSGPGELPRAEQVPMTTPGPMAHEQAAQEQAALPERSELEGTQGAVQAESGESENAEAAKACPREGATAAEPRTRSADAEEVSASEMVEMDAGEVDEVDEVELRGELEGSSAAVGAERGSAEGAEPTMLTGRIFYGGPTLPEDAEIRVTLMGANSGTVLAEQSLSAEGDPPYAFSLPVSMSEAAAEAQSVRVTIWDDGQVLYSTLQPFTPNLAERSVLPVQVQAD